VCRVAWLVELINLVSRLVGEGTSGDAYNRHHIRFPGVHNIGPVFLLWPVMGEQPPAPSTPLNQPWVLDYVTRSSSPVNRKKRAVGVPGFFSSKNWATRATLWDIISDATDWISPTRDKVGCLGWMLFSLST